ncbi:transposase [Haloferula sp.]|uniref:transposase n=1 Tax=Haloferula sp. TaxID=2497595 RepID=UPI003C7352D2
MITARSTDAVHLLSDDTLKDWFQQTLFSIADELSWKIEAWAILSNHYHFIAHIGEGEDNAKSLTAGLRKLHSLTTKELNIRDGTPGRNRLWQNFRDTHLTLQRGYLARLNYVHRNPVHHGIVRVATDYQWCSARHFKNAVSPAWLATVASFKFDEIAQKDGE